MKNVQCPMSDVRCHRGDDAHGHPSASTTDPRPTRHRTSDIGHRTTLCALLMFFVGASSAAEVICDGVLGNSGEQGASLVRFGDQTARGIGVAVDRFGSLWDRAGKGVLNRYAADGRLLGAYRIPTGENGNDQIAIVGDTLVLLLGGRLHTLAVTAPAGSEATALKVEAKALSFAAYKGRVAFLQGDKIVWFDPATSATEPITEMKDVDAVEVGNDGAVYARSRNQLHKVAGATAANSGWPKVSPGERPQNIDGWWYGHAWHGTIKRNDANLDPNPGVVLGGASGSFIGHLDQNSELSNARGMAKLWDGVFALSGIGGILQLASWDGATKQFTVVRRIGAVPACRGLGLDRDGRVFHHTGVWQWHDGPDVPMKFQINPPEGLGQVVMLDDERIVAATYLWGKPSFVRGDLTVEAKIDRIEKDCALPKDTVGAALYKGDGGWTLLTILADGKTNAFALDPEGRYRDDRAAVTLSTAQPVKEWTSLAMAGDNLLAAADGQVISFARDGEGWKESKRWNSWGGSAEQKFGARIHLGGDGENLVVADRERHRVLGFALTGGTPQWSFGTVDKSGTDLATMEHPETVAIRNGRVVVYDSGNQRLLKLRLVK
jgi:hypothetical protein